MYKIKNVFKGLFTVLLVGALVILSSCSKDPDPDPDPTKTLSQLISEDTDLSTFKSWVDKDTDLKAIIEGTTAYTVFAPNNAAFTKLEAILNASLDDVAPGIVKAVLSFAFVVGDHAGATITGGSFTSLQGEKITGNADGTIKEGGSVSMVKVSEMDVRATNGRLHTVETILIPPTLFNSIGLNLGKLSQTILLGKNFTTLAAGIQKADDFAASNGLTTLTSIIASSKEGVKYTVFAPTNATFIAAEITIDSFEGNQWYGLIANHIVQGSAIITPNDLIHGASFNTLYYSSTKKAFGKLTVFNDTKVLPKKNGTGIYFDSNGDVDVTNPTTLSGLDAELVLSLSAATNGTLHVIAGILKPTP